MSGEDDRPSLPHGWKVDGPRWGETRDYADYRSGLWERVTVFDDGRIAVECDMMVDDLLAIIAHHRWREP